MRRSFQNHLTVMRLEECTYRNKEGVGAFACGGGCQPMAEIWVSFPLQHLVIQIFLSLEHSCNAGFPNAPPVSKMNGRYIYISLYSRPCSAASFSFLCWRPPPPGPCRSREDRLCAARGLVTPISTRRCLSLIQLYTIISPGLR